MIRFELRVRSLLAIAGAAALLGLGVGAGWEAARAQSHVHMPGSFVHDDWTMDGHCEPFTLHGEPGYVSSEQSSIGQSACIGQSNVPFLHVHVSVVWVPHSAVGNVHAFPSWTHAWFDADGHCSSTCPPH